MNFRIKLALVATVTLSVLAGGAVAETCAFREAGWNDDHSPPTGPAQEVRLFLIGLDATGALAVKTAAAPMTSTDFSWQIDALISAAAPVSGAGRRTPLDKGFVKDTEIIYALEPSAWFWEERPDRIFQLKPRTRDGLSQPHNPFGSARLVEGRSNMVSVRFTPEKRYRGCGYEYNLGVVVRQTIDGEELETPIIIDPDTQNGTKP